MQAYKITEGPETGRLMIPVGNETMLLATPTKEQQFISQGLFDRVPKIEVNLEDEKWIHPHLYKPVKDAFNSAHN